MDAASGLHYVRPNSRVLVVEAAYRCQSCKRLSLATETTNNSQVAAQVTTADAAETRNWLSPTWLPRHLEVQEFEDVPPHIALAASEATLCLSVGAYRAVGSLARAVIEATAKDKHAEGRNLEKRIDALHASDHVRRHTKEQAHEIRHFGNDMAHGDFVDPVTMEEAEEVIGLMAEVLDEVYQSPARLEKRKAAREAKKNVSA